MVEFFLIHEAFQFRRGSGGESFEVEECGDEFEIPE